MIVKWFGLLRHMKRNMQKFHSPLLHTDGGFILSKSCGSRTRSYHIIFIQCSSKSIEYNGAIRIWNVWKSICFCCLQNWKSQQLSWRGVTNPCSEINFSPQTSHGLWQIIEIRGVAPGKLCFVTLAEKAYHGCFNCSYNITAATNLTDENWITA